MNKCFEYFVLFGSDSHSWPTRLWPDSCPLQQDLGERFFNILRPRQNGRHIPNDHFKRIFWNEMVWISLKISLKCVSKVQIINIPALVRIMAWCRPGDKPLSELVMFSLLTHICVTRPQWVKPCPWHQEHSIPCPWHKGHPVPFLQWKDTQYLALTG